MHSTQFNETALANLNEVSDRVELEQHLEQQANPFAQEPTDPIAARIRGRNRWRVREALETGEEFLQEKHKRGTKGFKEWLGLQGFALVAASKLIKLFEVFQNFSLDQIEWVTPETLESLALPRYEKLRKQLRSLSKWTDAKVQELMKQEREQNKTQKLQSKLGKEAGWRQVPGGGRAFKLPLLHDEETGMRIVQLVEEKNQTVQQVIKEAIALLFGTLPGTTLRSQDNATDNVPALNDPSFLLPSHTISV